MLGESALWQHSTMAFLSSLGTQCTETVSEHTWNSVHYRMSAYKKNLQWLTMLTPGYSGSHSIPTKKNVRKRHPVSPKALEYGDSSKFMHGSKLYRSSSPDLGSEFPDLLQTWGHARSPKTEVPSSSMFLMLPQAVHFCFSRGIKKSIRIWQRKFTGCFLHPD